MRVAKTSRTAKRKLTDPAQVSTGIQRSRSTDPELPLEDDQTLSNPDDQPAGSRARLTTTPDHCPYSLRGAKSELELGSVATRGPGLRQSAGEDPIESIA